ncbi:DMT family transporter [Desulfonatronum lacustre]|uniref:DMT family transporter n=1 Tax=Desulfonatronum lacustre TaxID=66849 RepID=UPI0004B1350F|nr:DMT family transporter [Desulfonatronum lacustre]
MLRGVDRLATGALFAATVLWAGSFIAMKLAIGVYGPMFVVFARMVLASGCLLLLVRRFKSVRYQRGDWKLLLFMALCEPCLYFVCEGMALTYTSASQAGMVVAMLPLMVAMAAWVVLKERLRPRTWFGFLLAILGVIWLTLLSETTDHAPNPLLGNFLEFLAMCCATGSMIALKKLCVRYSPLFLTTVQAFVGCVFFLPIMFLPGTTMPDTFHLGAVLSILYLGIGVTIVAYWFYNFGISRLPAGQASIFVNLIPVITLFLGWLILGERLMPMQYAAAFLVVIGVFLSQGNQASSRPVELTVRHTPKS